VTQLHDVVYIVCQGSSTILRFTATTHQRLTDIDVEGLSLPWDIVACELTSQLYVAGSGCVWRVSEDGSDIQSWLPKSPSDIFVLEALSLTSSRLLVTLPGTQQLIQFNADGDELRRVQLLANVAPRHAVESPTGTFIVSCYNRKLEQDQIIEVNTGGEVQRQFRGSHLSPLGTTPRVAVDSYDDYLTLCRVIVDEDQLSDDQLTSLCYIEQSGQLLVGLECGDVAMFGVLHR